MLALVGYEDREDAYILFDIKLKRGLGILNQHKLTREQLIGLLESNKVINVTFENGQIKTNGSVKRYKPGSIVIIAQIEESWYITVINEEIRIMSHKDIIQLYNNGLRIANGKVLKKKDGVQILSSIVGSYVAIERKRA